jgi:hypothetical protein
MNIPNCSFSMKLLHLLPVTAPAVNAGIRILSGSLIAVFVAFPEEPETAWLLWNGELLKWEPAGYSERRKLPAGTPAILLTPLSTVNAIAAGYTPHVHQNK